MAWIAPLTAVFNAVLTSAQWNTHIRDNSNETMPGKATTAGRWFVATGANAIAERAIDEAEVLTAETTTTTTYTDLATSGPAITVSTGTQALVLFAARLQINTDNAEARVSVAVSGATTVAASDEWMILLDGTETSNANTWGMMRQFTGLTVGSNTFTMKYTVNTGTGTFANRRICVIPF